MQRIYDGLHAGLKHLVVGLGLLIGLAVYGHYPDAVAGLFTGQKSTAPRMIAMHGDADRSCQENSVETLVGVLGCAGTRKAAHLEQITRTRGN